MTFKINIGTKQGRTYKLETESQSLIGKSLGEKIQGKNISSDLEGYEFEISGASDKSGFTAMKDVEGVGLKKELLTYGKAMKIRPKREGKKKQSNPKPKGLRLRKTVRGKTISEDIVQVNLKVLKEGNKKLEEVFSEQSKSPEDNKSAEGRVVGEPEVGKETSKEESKSEEKPEEKKEEKE